MFGTGFACSTQRTVDYVAKGNVRLSNLTAGVGAALNQAVAEGRLSDSKRLQSAEVLQRIVDGGGLVTRELDRIKAAYPDGNIPPSAFTSVDFLFSSAVVDPVFDLLTLVRTITDDQRDYLAVAVLALRELVLEIVARLGNNTQSYHRVMDREVTANV